MYQNQSIAVVIPCFNEERVIANVIRTMPDFVDAIYVIDDVSTDKSIENAKATSDPRLEVIMHERNSGVGRAIATGYKHAREKCFDIVAVMAGDGQMNPKDLESVIRPIAEGLVDYCKGNRFFHSTPLSEIPRHRLFGNIVLSALTKMVSGYWHVSDSQCGYTAINRAALEVVDWDKLYPRYGCPNDILVQLNIAEMRVGEVAVEPVYGPNWTSKMRPAKVFAPILWLLARRYVTRCVYRYAINNGHPLIFYLGVAAILLFAFLLLSGYSIVTWMVTGVIPKVATFIAGFTAIISTQLLLAAFSFDYEINQPLNIDLKQWQKMKR
jgi:glycosyltransferase involved in cell wall biosynthesis